MSGDGDTNDGIGKTAFKQVVGTSIGAIASGVTLAAISLYRKMPTDRIPSIAAGGTLVGILGFAGLGETIYDETIGRLPKAKSFVSRVDVERQPNRTR
jgi:hypothetical protein